jgi:lysozyme
MELGTAGTKLIQSFEQCRLTAYQDQRGIWTVGWGHTGHEVVPGLVWTQEQADSTFKLDTVIAVACVNHSVTAPVNQAEFDAMVSLCFNIGIGNFHNSSFVKAMNSGAGPQAEHDTFVEWDHTNSRVNPGLDMRRQQEWRLFSTGKSVFG